MKLLSKLSILVKSLARSPRPQRKREGRASAVDDPPKAQAEPGTSAVERDLEGNRVADLLERRLASSELDSQPNAKGD
jgi:hypothetical protein